MYMLSTVKSVGNVLYVHQLPYYLVCILDLESIAIKLRYSSSTYVFRYLDFYLGYEWKLYTYLCIYKEVSTYLLLAHSSITYNYRKRGFFCVYYVWSTKLASFTLLKTWENEQPKRKVGIKTASFKIHLDLSKKYTLDLYFSWGKLQKNIYRYIYMVCRRYLCTTLIFFLRPLQ